MKGGARPVKVAGRAFENLRDRIGDSKLSLNLRLYNTYDPYDPFDLSGSARFEQVFPQIKSFYNILIIKAETFSSSPLLSNGLSWSPDRNYYYCKILSNQ